MKLKKLKHNKLQFISCSSRNLEGFIFAKVAKCYYEKNIVINYSEWMENKMFYI